MVFPIRAGTLAVAAWCLYDWAYGAFNTVVSTFVIATYFVRAVAADPATGTAQWAGAQATAGLLIALMAAPLGSIADRSGSRRPMLAAFTALMVVLTGALWFVRPVPEDVWLALVLAGGATVAFEIATVFYNAMLTDVAPPSRLGRISGIAWGMGYGGGLCCLLLCLVLLIDPNPSPFGLDRAQAENVRAAALLAAAWIALFGWPVIVFVPDRSPRLPWSLALRQGLAGLFQVLAQAIGKPMLVRFLIARMLYTDGLTTLFAFGAIYAAGQFGMDAREVLLLGIALNVTAGMGALAFAFVEDRIGARTTVLASLGCMIVLGSFLLVAADRQVFWGLESRSRCVCRPGAGLKPQPHGADGAERGGERPFRPLCALRPGHGFRRSRRARYRHGHRSQPAGRDGRDRAAARVGSGVACHRAAPPCCRRGYHILIPAPRARTETKPSQANWGSTGSSAISGFQ